jgi:hypothetical protein
VVAGRVVVVLALAAALLPLAALTSSPAGATPGAVTDPIGDVQVWNSPSSTVIDEADLSAVGVDNTGQNIVFSVTTDAAAHVPMPDYLTITWTFDTTGDGISDGSVSTDGTFWFANDRPTCSLSVIPSGNDYQLTVPASCLDNPSQVSASATSDAADVGGEAADSTGVTTFATPDTWTPSLPSGNPIGHFESALPGPTDQRSAATIQVNGWALDPDTDAPAQIAVYLDGLWFEQDTANGFRPDVYSAHPDYGAAHGFSAVVPVSLSPGQTDTLCVFVLNAGPGTANTLLGCKVVSIPMEGWGHIEGASTFTDQISVWGWFIDPIGAEGPVDVYVDGKLATIAHSTEDDPLVLRQYPRYPDNSWYTTFAWSGGNHLVCATGLALGSLQLGCKTVTVGGVPVGHLDSASFANGKVTVAGWALDPDTIASIPVALYFTASGQATRSIQVTAIGYRIDVAHAYPGYGANHGFNAVVGLPKGTWTVTAYGMNVGYGSSNPSLG